MGEPLEGSLDQTLELVVAAPSCTMRSLFEVIADETNVHLPCFRGLRASTPRVGLAHPSFLPHGAFTGGDSQSNLIGVRNERGWVGFCGPFLSDPAFGNSSHHTTNDHGVTNQAAVNACMHRAFACLPVAKAIARLEEANVAFEFVKDVTGPAEHPAPRRITSVMPNGPVSMAASPARTSGACFGTVPAAGRHSDAMRLQFVEQRQPGADLLQDGGAP